MSTMDWPAARIFAPASMAFGLKKAVLQSRSPYSGSVLPTDLAAERWLLSITLPPVVPSESAAREAFLTRLSGGSNWVRVWHMQRPVPLGTMRGNPTLKSAVARGAKTLTISTTSGATLMAGDLFGLGGQLFMNATDAVADGSGNLAVEVVNRVRKAITSGAGVTWNKPTADFMLPADSVLSQYQPGYADSLAIDLEEVW